VIIPNDHGMTEVADALIYWNRPGGFKSLMPELLKERPMSQLVFGLLDSDRRHFTRLPAFGGGRAVVADLSRPRVCVDRLLRGRGWIEHPCQAVPRHVGRHRVAFTIIGV
jgi:hypothetical protein